MLLAELEQVWGETEIVGHEQGVIGAQQSQIGARQAEIGRRQAAIGVEQAEIGARQAAVGARQAQLAVRESRANRAIVEQEAESARRALRPVLFAHWQLLQTLSERVAAIGAEDLARAREALEITERGYRIGRFPYRELALAQAQGRERNGQQALRARLTFVEQML